MGQHNLLKSYGIICILFGLSLICGSPLVSYTLGEASLLTELAIGLVLVWFGARLIVISKKQDDKYPEEELEESGEGSSPFYYESAPFYYELEPVVQQRELPAIPKDIGREYDPIIVDKV
ncbi:hypothetical protein JTE90_009226 [Oedothorax gibbosus]|uniref:Transmembrane protein n=1 Tax=Oedothorax gibbosus TaxID=931172 RepID=A0AAV6URJ6_9ARAC|nr:hypothetical protein JTE90_009226 [Oedothorax gibbosus]